MELRRYVRPQQPLGILYTGKGKNSTEQVKSWTITGFLSE